MSCNALTTANARINPKSALEADLRLLTGACAVATFSKLLSRLLVPLPLT